MNRWIEREPSRKLHLLAVRAYRRLGERALSRGQSLSSRWLRLLDRLLTRHAAAIMSGEARTAAGDRELSFFAVERCRRLRYNR